MNIVKSLVKFVFNSAGFEIRSKRKRSHQDGEDTGTEFDRMAAIVQKHTMVSSRGLLSLYEQTVFCEKNQLPGAFVECGVWKGGAVGLMALVNLAHGLSRRHIHLFDSFSDICEPDDAVDGERAINEVRMWSVDGGTRGRLIPLKGFYDQFGGPGSVEENQQLLIHTIGYDQGYLHFHEGWIQDTLPTEQVNIGEIAILRIDMDWYASTKICLEHLFSKVISGGFVIIDDYGTYDGCKKAVDEFIRNYHRPLFLNHVNSDIKYFIVP